MAEIKFYWMTFYGAEEKPLKITKQEFGAIIPHLKDHKFVMVRGEMIATSLIKRITPIQEPLEKLSEPEPKPFDPHKYHKTN